MGTVRSILGLKGRDVTTGDPTQTVGQVCSKLAEMRVGAIVMTDESRHVIGIISERDIVRVIAAHGPEVLKEQAGRFMTRAVVTCTHDDTIDELMDTMTRGRFRHVPVLEGGRLAGIVSIGDVVKHRMAEIEREAQEIRNYIATA